MRSGRIYPSSTPDGVGSFAVEGGGGADGLRGPERGHNDGYVQKSEGRLEGEEPAVLQTP